METIKKQSYGGVDDLIAEIGSGEWERDILPNSALEFDDLIQAEYFSHMRRNMQTDIAYSIINDNQQLDELRLLKKWGMIS